MKSYDLHGCKLEEAMDFVESVIGKIRMKGREETIQVITGRGVIRGELIKYFRKHQIEFHFEIGNDGALIVHVD